MSVNTLQNFQDQVSELLLRHRSLLDILSKFQQSNASVNRSVVKSVTECGCIELSARKQPYSDELSAEEIKQLMQTHVSGGLCEQCREVLTSEVGKNLFYMAALCNVLGMNMTEVVAHESEKCSTLGFFNLS